MKKRKCKRQKNILWEENNKRLIFRKNITHFLVFFFWRCLCIHRPSGQRAKLTPLGADCGSFCLFSSSFFSSVFSFSYLLRLILPFIFFTFRPLFPPFNFFFSARSAYFFHNASISQSTVKMADRPCRFERKPDEEVLSHTDGFHRACDRDQHSQLRHTCRKYGGKNKKKDGGPRIQFLGKIPKILNCEHYPQIKLFITTCTRYYFIKNRNPSILFHT